MLEVLNVEERVDKNGKKYKYITLHSPEHKIKVYRNQKEKEVLTPSKTCGYVAYQVNYAESQTSDPQYNLKVGDKVEGRIVTKRVKPFLANGDMLTKCKVPVFCSEDDFIEFEVATIKAFKRAGKELYSKDLYFGEIFNSEIKLIEKQEDNIPKNCLIVKELY